MRYEILGPLRITGERGDKVIRARKIETLLTVLLVRADQVVGVDQLIMEIWGENPPKRATAGVHVYISQLRKILHEEDGRQRIITRAPGYMLDRGHDEIDYLEMQRHAGEGRRLARAGHHWDAVHSFEKALAIWRGNVLTDTPMGPALDGFTAWIRELRLECTENLMESRLHLGDHREVIAQLRMLVPEHPLREAFYRQLMYALYKSDQQAEALSVYHTARQRLNMELGLEPCRSLRDLHQSILVDNVGPARASVP